MSFHSRGHCSNNLLTSQSSDIYTESVGFETAIHSYRQFLAGIPTTHTQTFSWRLPPLDLYIYAGLYFLILSSLMWGSLFPPTWRSAIDIPALWNFACNCWDDHMSYGFCKSILTRKMELLPNKVSIHKHDLLALGQNCWCLFCHHWSHQRNEEQATNLYQRGRDFLRAHKRLTDISQRTGFELILSSTMGPKPG